MNTYSWQELHTLLVNTFTHHGVLEKTALSVTKALLIAESSGHPSHGLSRVPLYIPQVINGKINGKAQPSAKEISPVITQINAHQGFAFPAIDMAICHITRHVASFGLAAASIINSHHFGEAAWHVERIASQGYIALMFGNTPHAMSLWGGHIPLLGTNPIAFAAPHPHNHDTPLVVDLALSKVARGHIINAQQNKDTIPNHWAYDSQGQPTTNPTDALNGSMAPMGEAKGVALAVMVEIMSAALGGGSLSHDASSLLNDKGDPPRLSHTLIAIDPLTFSGENYNSTLNRFLSLASRDTKARLPGTSRFKKRRIAKEKGFQVEDNLINSIQKLCL